MIAALINAMRVGLVPRWLSLLGILSVVLIVLPPRLVALGVIPAFWMVIIGLLFAGACPGGRPRGPPEPRGRGPPPPRARAPSAGARQPALATGAGDVAPSPAVPRLLPQAPEKRGG